ncbi:MAG: glycosyltransferase family 1 protein [Acidobacteriota bacterium]
MRIAYDARPLTLPRTGIGRYLQGILDELSLRVELKEILLCSPRPLDLVGPLAHDARARKIVQLGWKGNLWLQVALPKILKQQKVDLFHGTLFLLPLLYPFSSIVNVYDLTVYRYPGSMEWKNRWILRLLLPWSMRRARRIVTLSEFGRTEIERRWPEFAEKITVIPGAASLCAGGVQPGERLDRAEAESVLRKYGVQEPYLLYVGTIEPRKNIERMVEAYFLARRMGLQDRQLVLVGPPGWGLGRIRSALQGVSRSGVKWIGYVPDRDLAILYRNAELFLYLSLYEGFGLPPLEAMASGTCVLAADRASLPECLGEAAVLVNPFQVDAIAKKLSELIRDADLRMDYTRKGYAQSSKFSWAASAAMTVELYRGLLS